ncbi:MAG: hypothetical protein ABSH11_09005 [Verrucomicrobiota bacterium]
MLDTDDVQQRRQAVGPNLSDGFLGTAFFLLNQFGWIHVLLCGRDLFLIREAGVQRQQPLAQRLAVIHWLGGLRRWKDEQGNENDLEIDFHGLPMVDFGVLVFGDGSNRTRLLFRT